ncbi:MAG: DUF692 family multinuclear iron-containing protein [Bradymonadia bacterium]
MGFTDRVLNLPKLGIGVSTEYGAAGAAGALDVEALWRAHPRYAGFLEIGVEASKGLDHDARAWAEAGRATTYHFLDINLDEPADFDDRWLARVADLAAVVRPAWMCGDAGLWHFGPRDRNHMLLLPPILSRDAALAMGEGVCTLRAGAGYEVLPENPPGEAFIGDLHLLDFFGQVCEAGDTGMLLDCAHLAIYQRAMGHDPLTAFDGFPLDRVVELHVAGGVEKQHEGFGYIADDHTPEVLDDTWRIFEHVVARASNLKAVVFECERNPLEDCLPGFARIAEALDALGWMP